MSTRKTPREEWFSLVEDVGSDPITEEQAILSTGRKFLPPCAIVVLDGGEPSDEYWLWLHTQTSKAQEERVRDGEATKGANE